MDAMVLRAMAKWPNVPAVHGWLSLDRRGRWLLRSEPIGNRAAIEFINRNYASDEHGCWYFQNGPQRVFVELESTPWIYRFRSEHALETHTARPVDTIIEAFVTPDYALALHTEHGIGLLEARDLSMLGEQFGDALGNELADELITDRLATLASGNAADLTWCAGGQIIALAPITETGLEARFGFIRSPQPCSA